MSAGYAIISGAWKGVNPIPNPTSPYISLYLATSRYISPHLAISPQAERRSELEDAAQLADQIENLVAEVAAQQARTYYLLTSYYGQ